MKLTQEEKNKLISAKDESEWYSICEEIKKRRNDLYPNDLAREVLDIYKNISCGSYKLLADNKSTIISLC